MISVYNVRYIFGGIVLGAHFLAMAAYIYIGNIEYRGRFFDDIFPGVLTLTPITGTYMVAFWKFVIRDGETPDIDQQRMKRRPFLLQLVMLLLFSVVLVVGIVLSFSIDVQRVQLFVGIMETIFGGFIGAIFNSLFPLREDSR